jgi:hypothetical protein
MIPIVLTRPACKKQVASPICLSQESYGFGLHDRKRSNPESNGANERHSLEYAQLLTVGKDLGLERKARSKAGEDG